MILDIPFLSKRRLLHITQASRYILCLERGSQIEHRENLGCCFLISSVPGGMLTKSIALPKLSSLEVVGHKLKKPE